MVFYGAYDVEKGVYDILGGSRRPWPQFSERQGLRIIVVDTQDLVWLAISSSQRKYAEMQLP